MKANYKVINNKQVQLRKVIEGFKPDDVASVILFRYNVMQALTSLNDDCTDFEEADMKETATDLTEFFEDAVNEAIDSFIDEDKRPNINFNGTADEFREELNNLVVVLLSKNFEHLAYCRRKSYRSCRDRPWNNHCFWCNCNCIWRNCFSWLLVHLSPFVNKTCISVRTG